MKITLFIFLALICILWLVGMCWAWWATGTLSTGDSAGPHGLFRLKLVVCFPLTWFMLIQAGGL